MDQEIPELQKIRETAEKEDMDKFKNDDTTERYISDLNKIRSEQNK